MSSNRRLNNENSKRRGECGIFFVWKALISTSNFRVKGDLPYWKDYLKTFYLHDIEFLFKGYGVFDEEIILEFAETR
jgi:hypothetical protein